MEKGPDRLGASGRNGGSSILRGLHRRRLLAGHMFDRDPLAVTVAVMARMRDLTIDDVLFRIRPVARTHLVSGRLGLGGLIRRRSVGSRGRGIRRECRCAQAESRDGGKRQHELVHDVLLG